MAREREPYMADIADKKTESLSLGDFVVLYSEEMRGYIYSNQSSSAYTEVGVGEDQVREFPNVPNIHCIIFQICVQHRYKFNKKLPKLKARVDRDSSDVVAYTQFVQAQRVASMENADNEAEQHRQTGKRLTYGQIIQLKHKFSGKYLHVNNNQTSVTETSNMLVELRPDNDKTALFRIMPRYKIKSEGEVVQIEDQVIFESVKSPGQFLHCSTSLFGPNQVFFTCHELNLSVLPSGFSIYRYYQPRKVPAPKNQTELKGGDFIRIYHRELEAYLVAEGRGPENKIRRGYQDAFLRVRPMDQAVPKSMYPSTSAITYWQVEKEKSSIDGGPIYWEEQIRLKHATTSMYLMIDDEKNCVALTEDLGDPLTIFRVHYVVKEAERVLLESCIRLEHVVSERWLHADNTGKLDDKPPTVGVLERSRGALTVSATDTSLVWSTAQLRKVLTTADMMYDDAYTIQGVPENLVDDMNFVVGTLPSLVQLVKNINDGDIINSRRAAKIRKTIQELTRFQQKQGTPSKQRQKLLRNFMVVDLVVELLKCPIKGTQNDILLSNVIVDALSLLYAYLQGDSRKNELYMGMHMDFFMNQIQEQGPVGLYTANMTMELLRNNRNLVGRISTQQIQMLCDLLRHNRNYRYLDLLSVLCICSDIALTDNQNFVLQELIIRHAEDEQEVVYFTKLGEDQNMTAGTLYVWDQRDKEQRWKPLRDLMTKSGEPSEQCLYFERQLRLFADLCKGRNMHCIETLTTKLGYVTWRETLAALSDKSTPDCLRGAYCRVVQYIFLDVEPNYSILDHTRLIYSYADLDITKHWSDVAAAERRTSVALGALQNNSQNQIVNDLKRWLLDFLDKNQNMVASLHSKNACIAEAIDLVHSLTKFGYFCDTEEIKRFVGNLLALLDGRTDLPMPVNAQNVNTDEMQQMLKAYRSHKRFEKATGTTSLVDAKFRALKVLELFFNLRFNVHTERLLAEFKHAVMCEESGAPKKSEFVPFLQSNFVITPDNAQIYQKLVTKYLSAVFHTTNFFGDNIVQILLDLCDYKAYPQLVTQSVLLLGYCFARYQFLFQYSTQAQVALTEMSVATNNAMKELLPQLRFVGLTMRLNVENVQILERIYNQLISYCRLDDHKHEAHSVNQDILRNHGIFADTLDILSRNMDKTRGDQVRNVQRICFKFLRALALGNQAVQEGLFARFSQLLKIPDAEEHVAALFFEVFSGNKALCLKLLPGQVLEMVQRLASTLSPTMARLLTSIVVVGKLPLRRNQSLVVKGLLQHKAAVELLVDSTPEERLKLLTAPDTDLECATKKKYLCCIVQLLGLCAVGENRAVESLCQSIFTFDELLRLVVLPNLCGGMRTALVQFLHSVFLTVEQDRIGMAPGQIRSNSQIWKYIEIISYELKHIREFVVQNKPKARLLMRRRPVQLHKSASNVSQEAKETFFYVFDAALPFLDVFFRNLFSRSDASVSDSLAMVPGLPESLQQAEQNIVRRFLEELTKFSHEIYPCLSDNAQVSALLNTFREVLTATNLNFVVPEEIITGICIESSAKLKFMETYVKELGLNSALDTFAKNVERAYGGLNTVRAQIGYPMDQEYTNLEGDTALQLGREFQDFVAMFVRPGAHGQAEKYGRAGHIVQHLRNSLDFQNVPHRRRMLLEKLDCKCFLVLRAAIDNEILKSQDARANRHARDKQLALVDEVQSELTKLGLVATVLPHLARLSDDVFREALALMVSLLEGGNKAVQKSFVQYFENTREESFFIVIKNRMALSGEFTKERRSLLAQHKLQASQQEQFLKTIMARRGSATYTSRRGSTVGSHASSGGRPGTGGKTNSHVSLWHQKKMKPKGAQDNVPLLKKTMEMEPLIEKGLDRLGGVVNPFAKAAIVAQGLEEAEDLFQHRDTGYIELLLRLLASLCDGQNEQLQEFIREQRDNVKSVNILVEIIHFLSLIYSGINVQSIGLLTQIFDTLIETAQGNYTNQIVIFDQKVVDYINFVLRLPDFPGCSTEDEYTLKRSIGILLTDITEENTKLGHTKMIMEAVSKEELNKAMIAAYDLLVGPNALHEPDDKAVVAEVGYNYHHLLCRAFDLEPDLDKSQFCKSRAWKYFDANSLSVEILKGENLQRVYFNISNRAMLREVVKEKLKWQVDRSSPTNKLRDFLSWARDVRSDIHYQRRVQSNPITKFLVHHWGILNTLVLCVTFAINLLILSFWQSPKVLDPLFDYSVYGGTWRPIQNITSQRAMFGLSITHTLLAVMVMASYLLANKPSIKLPGFITTIFVWLKRACSRKRRFGQKHALAGENKEVVPEDIEMEEDDSHYTHSKTASGKLSCNVLSTTSLYYIFFLVMSILGTTVNYGFFAFHLLHICLNNQLLSRVILAVTLNGRSMLWVVFLGIIIIYIFALLGFLFLRNIYDDNQLFCPSMWQCFVVTMREGLMTGLADHFDIPNTSDLYTFSVYAFKAIFDIAFFALITTIGLNIIFGIIVDTFSQLRDEKWNTEQDMKNTCFICGRSSYEFEHHGKGFQYHIKQEHNMWSYLFFFIHLDDTPKNDLTCLELYVYEMVMQEQCDFFPLGRALTLSQWEEENSDSRLDILMNKVDYLVNKLHLEEMLKMREAERQRQLMQLRDLRKYYRKADDQDTEDEPISMGGMHRVSSVSSALRAKMKPKVKESPKSSASVASEGDRSYSTTRKP